MYGSTKSVMSVGSVGAIPGQQCHTVMYTNVESTPLIAEKPFIVEDNGKFGMVIPGYETDKTEPGMPENYNAVPFERVYVATDEDTAETLNEMVNHVNYLLLQPGVYNLDRPLVLKRDNMVVLGIGMPTLRSTNGNSVIQVM